MPYYKIYKNEVSIYRISYAEGLDAELEKFLIKIEEKEGKIIFFNPFPFNLYHCFLCGKILGEKKPLISFKIIINSFQKLQK